MNGTVAVLAGAELVKLIVLLVVDDGFAEL